MVLLVQEGLAEEVQVLITEMVILGLLIQEAVEVHLEHQEVRVKVEVEEKVW